MRFVLIAAALALSGCTFSTNTAGTQNASGCERTATHNVTWSTDGADDTITTRSDGPTCAQAVVTFVARNSAGDPLWVFASTYYDMTSGGIPPEGAPAITDEQMDTFLAGWANVTLQRSGELPAWREGFDSLSASAQTFSYDTPFDRETYEAMRARNLQMICYAAAVEATQCLIIDPSSHAPIMIVAYGP
ncbi:MAG: hypothetical protein NT015_04115 [Alphaproteobacteria bacterium]|nr:hypothetical protein [Alphaproteobacteria bacterium]